MSLTLRPYQPTEANVITTWPKSEYLMRQWCADRYERYPVTPDDMNSFHQQYIDGHRSIALTMVDEEEVVGYITLRIPADDPTELRMGFVIVDDSKRGRGLGKSLVNMAVDYAFKQLGAKKCHLVYLKTILLQYTVMSQQDFIVHQDRKPRATNVLAKRGIVSRWKDLDNNESNAR